MRITIIFFLITLTTGVYSQVRNYIPKIGLSYANMFWGGTPRGDLKPGVCVGTTFDYKISEKKYLESGLLLVQKGASFDLTPSVNSDYLSHLNKFTLNYIVIPASIKFIIDHQNKCFLNLGLFGGYLIKGTLRDKRTYRSGPPYDNKSKIDMSSFRRFDLGLQIGGGYKIKITPVSRLNFEICYDLSITSLYGEWYSDLVKRNIAYLLFLGYEFDL